MSTSTASPPKLTVRRARIEDNDDLVPICNTQSEILTSIYGEFYLASLIQSQNEHQHALVAEYGGRAVGLIGITDQVDVKLLQECFDLEAYENMRQQSKGGESDEVTESESSSSASAQPSHVIRMSNIFKTIMTNPPPSISSPQAPSKRSSLVTGGGGGSSKSTTTPLLTHATLVNKQQQEAVALSEPLAEGATSFPAVWLQWYIDSYRPDSTATKTVLTEEEEEAAKVNPSVIGSKLQALLQVAAASSSSSPSSPLSPPTHQLDATSFNDLLIQLITDTNEYSLTAILRFFEKLVKVPANMSNTIPVDPEVLERENATAGENVFCITLFCLDTQYDMMSSSLLSAIFDIYPERMYCLLTLPHVSSPNTTVGELLKYFTYIKPTQQNLFGHALYLLHRNTVMTMGELKVEVGVIGKEGVRDDVDVEVQADSTVSTILSQLMPLISHLPNSGLIRSEIISCIHEEYAREKLLQEGKEYEHLLPIELHGLSGQELLSKRKEIKSQLLQSKVGHNSLALLTCMSNLVGFVLFNRLSRDEIQVMRRDFDFDALISYEKLPTKKDIPAEMLPRVNPCDPTAPVQEPLEDLTRSSHLNIIAFVLNPLWNNEMTKICQEMLELTHADVLYYQIWSEKYRGCASDVNSENSENGIPLLPNVPSRGGLNLSYEFACNSSNGSTSTGVGVGQIIPQLLDTLIQIRPKECHVLRLQSGSRSYQPLPCSMYIITRDILKKQKTVINSRIVIVGASTTSLAFLENLLLQEGKLWNNVTLLSKEGLCVRNEEEGESMFLPSSLSYSSSHLARLNFGARIRILNGVLTDLDTTEKMLLLADGNKLPYDLLILTPGLQNQLPIELMRSITSNALRDEVHSQNELRRKHAEFIRDARRKKKAQEQGLDDTSTLDEEALARLDEELEKEAKENAAAAAQAAAQQQANAKKKSSGGNKGDAEDGSSEQDEEQEDLLANFGLSKTASSSSSATKHQHNSWRAWLHTSANGLESWETEYGSLLRKQRSLSEGTLNPSSALKINAEARKRMEAGEEIDLSQLDLTPYGITGLYRISNQDDVRELVTSIQKLCGTSISTLHSGISLPYMQNTRWAVNGACLESLTTISGLIGIGVLPKNITWIHPLQEKQHAQIGKKSNINAAATTLGIGPSSISFLNQTTSLIPSLPMDDPFILSRIMQGIKSSGVKVEYGKRIKEVKQEQGKVTGVVLVDVKNGEEKSDREDSREHQQDDNDTGLIDLPVTGIIGCGSLDVDPYIFRSVHGSSLVYDGRLVLSHTFQTTIPTIYAAGPCTKFSRVYGKKVLKLEEYNSKEVGMRLAEAVMKTAFEEGSSANGKEEAEEEKKIDEKIKPSPLSSKLPLLGLLPKVTQALLPSGLVYFHAKLPTTCVPATKKILQPKILTTQTEKRMTRLVFDDRNVLVEVSVVYSAPDPTDSSSNISSHLTTITSLNTNLLQLLGMPASYMNRIISKYQASEIGDLVEFLTADWSHALYHESFSHLRAYLHYFLYSHRTEIVSILDKIIQGFTNGVEARREAKNVVKIDGEVVQINEIDSQNSARHRTPYDPFLISQLTSLLPAAMKEQVQRTLLKFLRHNVNHLSGYSIPKPFYAGPQASVAVTKSDAAAGKHVAEEKIQE